MDRTQRGPSEPPDPDSVDASGERRRIGRVVHDDRGTARVEWEDAPPEFAYERPKLEVETFDDTVHRLAILREGAADPFNPYDQKATPRRAPVPPAPKRDLRKLSEWIKMMRGLHERKQRLEDEDEEAG